ncbi:myo-inositol 2-dehydrogenase-like isoform X1 [Saccostrea echinata]|uniref:myo-inositol 2-dehydrogenase-like isoform X1 n=1 Tax=Saccostrea echinata TaxID=191078 RepID=UPI002A801C86|nr:myo-inositol 2-dehydrogenase-like isoform X1 [Saccostrea echinata]
MINPDFKMDSSRRLGAALFGVGRIGQVHLKNMVDNGRLAIRWLVDVPAQHGMMNELIEKHRLTGETEVIDIEASEKVFEDPRVDVVIICTPTPSHSDIIKRALSAGKHVMCEKPLTLTVLDTKECYEVARNHDKILFCAYNRRFDKQFYTLYSRYRKGEIGKLRVVKFTSREGGQTKEYLKNNKSRIFLDMAIHDIDYICWLVGEKPSSVCAFGSISSDNAALYQTFDDFDSVTAILNFPNGVMAQMEATREANIGYEQKVEVLGTKGLIQTQSIKTSELYTVTQESCKSEPLLQTFLDRYMDSFPTELNHFINAVQGKEDILVTAQSCITAMEVSDALSKSLKTNSIVHL